MHLFLKRLKFWKLRLYLVVRGNKRSWWRHTEVLFQGLVSPTSLTFCLFYFVNFSYFSSYPVQLHFTFKMAMSYHMEARIKQERLDRWNRIKQMPLSDESKVLHYSTVSHFLSALFHLWHINGNTRKEH